MKAVQYVNVTRPEIVFSVNKVSQFMTTPLDEYGKIVKWILKYLKGTLHTGILFCYLLVWLHVCNCWLPFRTSGYLETKKKSGVLSLLFEYSSQRTFPSICLEALQVIYLECFSFGIGVLVSWLFCYGVFACVNIVAKLLQLAAKS